MGQLSQGPAPEGRHDVDTDDAFRALSRSGCQVGPVADPRGQSLVKSDPRLRWVDIETAGGVDLSGGLEQLGLALGFEPALVGLPMVWSSVSDPVSAPCCRLVCGHAPHQSRPAARALLTQRVAVDCETPIHSATSFQKYIDQTNDAGYAAETAAIRLDNLKGDVEALGGALDSALIKTGESANGPLRSLTQGLTGAVEAYANLDPAVQGANLKIGAGIAAVGTAGGAFLLAAPKVVEFKNAVDGLGPGAQKASSAVLALGKAAGAATAIVGLALAADKLSNSNDKAAAGIEGTSKALRSSDIESLFSGLGQDVNSYADALKLLTGDGANAKMERFGSTLNGALFGGAFSDQVAQTKEQIDTVGQSLGELVSSGDAERAADLFDQLAEKAAAEGVSRKELLDLMPAYRDAVAGVSTEQADAADPATQQADALTGVSGAAQDATFDIDAASDAIRNFASATLDSRAAARDLEAAVDDVAAAVAENGTTLDINTSQGRANEAALDAVAESAKGLAASTLEQTGSQEQAPAALANGRQKLIESLGAFGITGQAAEDYADKLGLIPSSIKTTVSATTSQAQADLDGFITRNNGRVISVRQQLITEAIASGAAPGAAKAAYRAQGGPIYGPGTGTSDSIPAWLSNGEHVLTKREVDAAGGHGAIMALRREILRGYRPQGYATGGPVGSQVQPRYAPPSIAPQVNVAPATVMIDTPVYADGSLIGTMRGVAGQEIQFALATENTRLNQKWRPE